MNKITLRGEMALIEKTVNALKLDTYQNTTINTGKAFFVSEHCKTCKTNLFKLNGLIRNGYNFEELECVFRLNPNGWEIHLDDVQKAKSDKQ